MISIVIPFYNHRSYIQSAYSSLLKQTYHDWELLFIDNNSSDGSLKLANELVVEDSRVIVITETKQGIANARNAGIKQAKGELITFLDIDDEFIETKLEDLLQVFNENPAIDMAYGLTRRVYLPEKKVVIQDKGIVKEGINQSGVLTDDWIDSFYRLPQTGATLIRTKVAREVGGFDEFLKLGNDDVGFHIKIAQNYKIGFLNKEVVVYYRHSASAGAKLNGEVSVHMRYFEAYWRLILPLVSKKSDDSGSNKAKKITIRHAYYNLIQILYASKNKSESLRQIKNNYHTSFPFPYSCLITLALILPYNLHRFITKATYRIFL